MKSTIKMNVSFGTFVDVIEFETLNEKERIIFDNYRSEFYEWFHVRRVPSADDPKKLIYREDIYPNCNAVPIVIWMNEMFPNCNARIVSENLKPGEEDSSLPYMYF